MTHQLFGSMDADRLNGILQGVVGKLSNRGLSYGRVAIM